MWVWFGKRHPDSREKRRAATRLPRGAQRFASLPGSLQALTHQQSLPPPVRTPDHPLRRLSARQPPTFHPPPFSYLPVCRLASPSSCLSSPRRHPARCRRPSLPIPFSSENPILTRDATQPNPTHASGRRPPCTLPPCPRDPAALRHATCGRIERKCTDKCAGVLPVYTWSDYAAREDFRETRVNCSGGDKRSSKKLFIVCFLRDKACQT